MPMHWHIVRAVTGINPCIWTHCIIVCGNWWRQGGAKRYTKQVFPYHIGNLAAKSIYWAFLESLVTDLLSNLKALID
jgi:hypothetical protein